VKALYGAHGSNIEDYRAVVTVAGLPGVLRGKDGKYKGRPQEVETA
jgi:hypothetical protein